MHRPTIPVLLLFLLFPLASAAESFTVQSDLDANLCTNLLNTGNALLTNTGDVTSTYLVRAESPGILVNPNYFSLNPGNRAELSLSYDARKAGAQQIAYTIETSRGLSQRVTHQASAGRCSNNLLIAQDFNQSSCPCKPAEYHFTLTNTGKQAETYTFALDKYSEQATLSHNPLILAPGQTGSVTLTLELDCAVHGEQILKFYSRAQQSGVAVEVPLALNINACYDYAIDTGRLLSDAYTQGDISFSRQPGSYQLCVGDTNLIPVEISNTGYIDNTYSLSLNGPSWGMLGEMSADAKGGESALAFLSFSPDTPGSYTFTLSARSALGDARTQEAIPIEVRDCHALHVDLPPEARACVGEENEITGTVTNLGAYDERVEFGADGYAEAQPLFVDAGQASSFTLTITPEKAGRQHLTLNAWLENGRASAQDTMRLDAIPAEQCRLLDISADSRVYVKEWKSIVLEAEHRGAKASSYVVSLDAPSWVSLDTEKFTLQPGERRGMELVADAKDVEPGLYDVRLNLTTEDGNIFSKKIVLSVHDSPTFMDLIHQWRYWIISVIIFGLALALAARRNKGLSRANLWIALTLAAVLLLIAASLLGARIF